MIAIVDYQVGNIGSIENMFRHIDVPAIVTADPKVILAADKLILPGTGAFDNGMINLRRIGLMEVLERKVKIERAPVLGICLGAQLMTQSSEEGNEPGLGWVKAQTIRFFSRSNVTGYRVPHMGWSETAPVKKSRLWNCVPDEARFYFVHSYHFVCDNADDILAESEYGYRFISAFEHDNCFGVQFHPEKSHKYGMALLRSFAQLAAPLGANQCEGVG